MTETALLFFETALSVEQPELLLALPTQLLYHLFPPCDGGNTILQLTLHLHVLLVELGLFRRTPRTPHQSACMCLALCCYFSHTSLQYLSFLVHSFLVLVQLGILSLRRLQTSLEAINLTHFIIQHSHMPTLLMSEHLAQLNTLLLHMAYLAVQIFDLSGVLPLDETEMLHLLLPAAKYLQLLLLLLQLVSKVSKSFLLLRRLLCHFLQARHLRRQPLFLCLLLLHLLLEGQETLGVEVTHALVVRLAPFQLGHQLFLRINARR